MKILIYDLHVQGQIDLNVMMRSIQAHSTTTDNQPTEIIQKSSPKYQVGVNTTEGSSWEYETSLYHQDDHIFLVMQRVLQSTSVLVRAPK